MSLESSISLPYRFPRFDAKTGLRMGACLQLVMLAANLSAESDLPETIGASAVNGAPINEVRTVPADAESGPAEASGASNGWELLAPPPDAALVEWDRNLVFTAPDNRFSLNIRGRIQPRYEFERREDEPNHSSFFIRRATLDFRGHAYTEDLTYRISPEWNREATMRDVWADYRFSEAVRVRFGQFKVPFDWDSDSSSSRHQLVEISVANSQFRWNDGRDIGLMLHGAPVGSLRYGAGVFGGAGRNVRRSESDGNLFAGRVTWSPVGAYLDAETLLTPLEGPNVTFGLGTGYNTKNTTEDWEDANVFGATAEAHFQVNRFSSHLLGFYRNVDPRGVEPSFNGRGFSAQAGFLFLPERLFGTVRFSHSEPDSDTSEGRQRELLGGLQIFHIGHQSKVHIEAGRIQTHSGEEWLDTEIVRCQYQFLF